MGLLDRFEKNQADAPTTERELRALDVRRIKSINPVTIEKHSSIVPPEMIEIWQTHGLCTMLDGFIKVIDPDLYMPALEASYLNYKAAIPLFATGMCDLYVWENGYLVCLNYRTLEIGSMMKGMHFFERFLSSKGWVQETLKPAPFYEAAQKHGAVELDYGFGYTPILPMGGKESVDNLDKVRIPEHIAIISQMVGPFGH